MSPDNSQVVLVGSISFSGLTYMPLLILNANTGATISSNSFVYASGSEYLAEDAFYF